MEHEEVVHEFVGFRVLQLLTLVFEATCYCFDNQNVTILGGCLNELELFVYIVHHQLSIPGANGNETLHAWLVQLERTLQSADTMVQRCGKRSRFNIFSRYMTTKGILKSTAEVKELLRQMVLFGLSFGFLQLRDVQKQARSMKYMREVLMDLNLADVTRDMSANVMHLNLADVQRTRSTHMPQDPRTRPIAGLRLASSPGFLEDDHGTTNQYYRHSHFEEKKDPEPKKQRHLQTKVKTSGQPIDYSQLVLETITKVQKWTCDEIMFNWNSGKQSLRLNQLQCKHIASKLEETQVYLQSQIDCFPRHIKCGVASQQLYLVVKKAEMLVAECCSEDWLQKALVPIEIKEHIVEILLDLQWWTDMVRISAISELEEGMYTAQLHRADKTYEELLTFCQTEHFLSKEVEHDNQTLMKQLDQVLKSRTQCQCLDIFSKKPKEDLELTNYLLHRLGKTCQSNIDAPWKPSVVYTTQNYLGDGSFSTVWEAPWLGQDFALKRSKLLFQRPSETTNITLANEANIHARSCHPHIVQLMCYWEEGTKGDNMPFNICLLMEKMTGDLH
jgi:hypothetical protein